MKPWRERTTTADDLVWWYRARIASLGLDTWFHPSVEIFRRGSPQPLEGDAVIQPGDMLWTDFGITYLRLNTDTQQLAYVLRPGEREAPAGTEMVRTGAMAKVLMTAPERASRACRS